LAPFLLEFKVVNKWHFGTCPKLIRRCLDGTKLDVPENSQMTGIKPEETEANTDIG
jgi:hypothetical protein